MYTFTDETNKAYAKIKNGFRLSELFFLHIKFTHFAG